MSCSVRSRNKSENFETLKGEAKPNIIRLKIHGFLQLQHFYEKGLKDRLCVRETLSGALVTEYYMMLQHDYRLLNDGFLKAESLGKQCRNVALHFFFLT